MIAFTEETFDGLDILVIKAPPSTQTRSEAQTPRRRLTRCG